MQNKPPLNDSFSRAMSYFKSLRGKNNKDISDALGIPPTTVSAWNTGRHLPDMERLQRLAAYLQAPLDQFFNFSLDNLPNKEIADLQEIIKTNSDIALFLKMFLKLSEEDKHLLTVLATKLSK